MRVSPAWALALGALAAVVVIAAVAGGARAVLVSIVLLSVLVGAYLVRGRTRHRLLYDRDTRRGGRP